jgi:hypothetical protein
MNKPTLLVIAALLFSDVSAQEITKQEKGYFNITELGYFLVNNAYEYQTNPNTIKVVYDGAYALSLRNINGVFLTNKIALGIGVGLENYTHKSDSYNWDNTFQVFFDTRYYFRNEEQTFFAYGDIGSSISISDNIEKGSMVNLGLGYKVKLSKKTALLGSIGFINQNIDEETPILRNRYYGFAFKVGLLL